MATQVGSQYAMPFWTQTRVLLRKYNLAYWRTPSYNFVRMGMTFITRWGPRDCNWVGNHESRKGVGGLLTL